jgi:hypothetical protein
VEEDEIGIANVLREPGGIDEHAVPLRGRGARRA